MSAAARGRKPAATVRRPRPDQLDELSTRLLDSISFDKVVFDNSVALDFRAGKLKPDHERRPFWVTPNGRIFLEASSSLYKSARDFLVAICEPVSRPDFVHEYRLDKNSLFAAASMGMTPDIIIGSLKRMSKTPVAPAVEEFIASCAGGYGKVKLVLKRGRYFIESAYPAVLRLLTKHPAIRKARVRTLVDGTRVIGMDAPIPPLSVGVPINGAAGAIGVKSNRVAAGDGDVIVLDDDADFIVAQALAENETSLGLNKLVDGAKAGDASSNASAAAAAAAAHSAGLSGEVDSDDEDSAALARAYAAATRSAASASGAGGGPGGASLPTSSPTEAFPVGNTFPSTPVVFDNPLDHLEDLSAEALEDMMGAIDTAIADFEAGQARAAAITSMTTASAADRAGARTATSTGGARAVSFMDDGDTLGYDAFAAGPRRNGKGSRGMGRGMVVADGPRGKSLLDKHAEVATENLGEEDDGMAGELRGEELAAKLIAEAKAAMAGAGATATVTAPGKVRFKLKGTNATAAGISPSTRTDKVASRTAGVGESEDPTFLAAGDEGDVSGVGVVHEEPTPNASELTGDFVTRSGLVYADGEAQIASATIASSAASLARGPPSAAVIDADDGEEDYRKMVEEDDDFVMDDDALAADAEAEAVAEAGVDDDNVDEFDDGFVRRKKAGKRAGVTPAGRGGGTRGRGRGRGAAGAGIKRTAGARSGPRVDGEDTLLDLAGAPFASRTAGEYDEEEAAREALERERAAKRARLEAIEAVGDGLDAFRAEVARLGDTLHLTTPDTVEAFEIDPLQVEAVRFVCLHLDPPFPLMQEYDHAGDSAGVPPLLDSDKKPVLLRDPSLLRDYQQKSLAKMFGNGRARSGIIVLPCGAGKTLVGIAACVTVGKSCVVLCPNAMSVVQWEDQFVRYCTIPRDCIIKLTSKHKSAMPPRHQACVLITTYTMMAASRRSRESEALMRDISGREWGLQLLDEVHLAVAEKYSQALKLRCHTRLGLTATLVREDAKEVNLAHMIGPKLYEANWMDLTREKYLANVQCTEVWCPMAPEFYREYCRAKGEHTRMALACCNPVKCWAMDFLLKLHEGRGDKVIIFSESIFAIQLYAAQYQGIVIAGSTPQREREAYIHAFRNTDTVNKLFLSRVGDMALDVPDANVIIQISAHYGSRLQEAQRMGRILRRGTRGNAASGNNAYFYSLVSLDTREMADATRRRRYLVDQGYAYRVVEAVPGLSTTLEGLSRSSSFQNTPGQRMAVLESVLRENLEEMEARESGHLEELDVAPEIGDEGKGEGEGEGGEGKAKGPGARRALDVAAGAAGAASGLLPPSKLSSSSGVGAAGAGSSASRLAALAGGHGRSYIEYQAAVSGTQALAASDRAAQIDRAEAARAKVMPRVGVQLPPTSGSRPGLA